MKKLIIAISVIFVSLVITSCGYKELPIKYYHADYPGYREAASLAENVDCIYEGIVTKIYFDTISHRDGKSKMKGEDSSVRFHTIYEIEVKKVMKGNCGEAMSIMVVGGIENQYVEEQNKVLNERGFDSRIIYEDTMVLEVGKEYLFATCKCPGKHQIIPNPNQFAFSSEKDNPKSSITYEMMKAYLESEE